MKKKEAKRLRDIANELDNYCYDLYYKDPKHSKEAQWFHWGATEIRKVIMNGGYNGIIDAKYRKEVNWELKEDE